MNQEEPQTSLSCVPGLVSAHGMSDSLSTRFASCAVLEQLRQEGRLYSGKVRDRIDLGDNVLLFTSDRVSAFDVVLDLVPNKGEVLNRISQFWFEQTSDIIANHCIQAVASRGLLARKARVVPIEVVVRGYLTGSAWRDYQAGRPISGISLPAGMRRDQRFETALLTPSTKEELGKHDEPISSAEIVRRGIVTPKLWQKIEASALALFERGTQIAAKQGLILVDTKYEFGLIGKGDAAQLTLIDEIHTPDSSRFWFADSYLECFENSRDQRKLDKEYLREWLMAQGWSGHGPAPVIPAQVLEELSRRYILAYELITGQKFLSICPSVEAEANSVLSMLG